MSFNLSIIDTKRSIYEGEATKLTIPALGGEMTVLENHMSVVTPVVIGEVRVGTPGKDIALTIGKGMFSMEGNAASLLVEDAMYTEEISEKEMEEAKQKAEEIIAKGIVGPDMEAALQNVRRSALNLKVARRKKLHLSA